ncbi:MFS transporter [candidate division CSSED10-310 bacterium]|uniref:MFS transporter n=1 Tax=candidate division CSSED10-310 bacterium TaxID=2855610 RepID=A0ABV6Z1N3_UNCC1
MSMIALQGGPFLPAFVIALGGTNYHVGLLTTIALIGQVTQIPGLFLVNRYGKRRLITVFSTLAYRLMWCFILLIPAFFVNKGVFFLLVCLLIAELVGSVSAPPWNSLIRDIVPQKVFGKVFSTLMMLGSMAALTLTMAGGYFVDWWKVIFPQKQLFAYSMLFGLGVIFGLIGTYALGKLPELT